MFCIISEKRDHEKELKKHGLQYHSCRRGAI